MAAPSCSVPCGPPSASRSIRPSGGSGVPGPIPASSSARVFAQAPCTSLFTRNAGRPPVCWSSSCRLGVPLANHSIRQPLPAIHSASGCPAMYRAIRASASSRDCAPIRLQRTIVSPANAGCACASWKPGSSARPFRSTTSQPGPAASLTSRSPWAPTATTRPPRTATAAPPLLLASAPPAGTSRRPVASGVYTAPPVKSRLPARSAEPAAIAGQAAHSRQTSRLPLVSASWLR